MLTSICSRLVVVVDGRSTCLSIVSGGMKKMRFFLCFFCFDIFDFVSSLYSRMQIRLREMKPSGGLDLDISSYCWYKLV